MSFKQFLSELAIYDKSPDASRRLKKIEAKVPLDEVFAYLKLWFDGSFMGGKRAARVPKALGIFKTIGEVYHIDVPKTLYRVTKYDVKKLGRYPTGKHTIPIGFNELTAWSKNEAGAVWFYNYARQNFFDLYTEPNLSWILVSSEKPEPLLDYTCVVQFMSDCAYTDRIDVTKVLYLNHPDYTKTGEILCRTTRPLPVTVLEVFR